MLENNMHRKMKKLRNIMVFFARKENNYGAPVLAKNAKYIKKYEDLL